MNSRKGRKSHIHGRRAREPQLRQGKAAETHHRAADEHPEVSLDVAVLLLIIRRAGKTPATDGLSAGSRRWASTERLSALRSKPALRRARTSVLTQWAGIEQLSQRDPPISTQPQSLLIRNAPRSRPWRGRLRPEG